MPAYIRATKTRRVILATDESTMDGAQSRRRWLKYGAPWNLGKKKKGKKNFGVQKKKKKKKEAQRGETLHVSPAMYRKQNENYEV